MMPPTATYRLQLRGGMTFARAATLAPQLADLGISHLYLSPIFEAVRGSMHGYDVVDNAAIAGELGGEAGFRLLGDALRRHGIGLILDFVPNHMAASPQNPWWRDVLEWGAAARHARHFDIDWSAPKLILPMLAGGYGKTLAQGELGLSFDAATGAISLTYADLELPLTPPSYGDILGRAGDGVLSELARLFAVSTPETAPPLQSALAAGAQEPATAALISRVLDADEDGPVRAARAPRAPSVATHPLACGPGDADPPTLLRDCRPGRSQGGADAGVRRCPCARDRPRKGGQHRWIATGPYRWPRRSEGVPRAAAGGAGGREALLSAGREDPGHRRGAAGGLAGGGNDWLRVHPRSRRPAGGSRRRGRDDRGLSSVHRREHRLRGPGQRHQAARADAQPRRRAAHSDGYCARPGRPPPGHTRPWPGHASLSDGRAGFGIAVLSHLRCGLWSRCDGSIGHRGSGAGGEGDTPG